MDPSIIKHNKDKNMPNLQTYFKPTELKEALDWLGRPSPIAVPLAGGTWLNPRIGKAISSPYGDLSRVEAVIDLSELELGHIERDPDTLRLGPMATLAAVTEDATCQSLADGMLAHAAHNDASLNMRNAATVGGTVVVAPVDSELVLALLALAAELSICCQQIHLSSLHRFLDDPAAALRGGLITQVRVDIPLHIAGGWARVARTGADHPIAAAYAVIAEDGDARRIAIGGVARRPLVVSFDQLDQAGEAVRQAIEAAEPYQDMRGSAEYRRAMGTLMAQRAWQMAIANRNRC